jgi:hypothetical protein
MSRDSPKRKKRGSPADRYWSATPEVARKVRDNWSRLEKRVHGSHMRRFSNKDRDTPTSRKKRK